jgi:hypothetical protein
MLMRVWDQDYFEFVLRPSEGFALYKASSDTSVFLYPLQQPLSDFGALEGRLDGVRESLGWLEQRFEL